MRTPVDYDHWVNRDSGTCFIIHETVYTKGKRGFLIVDCQKGGEPFFVSKQKFVENYRPR